jgi:predicted  nucleic acid-binding Zn-ribbon protein
LRVQHHDTAADQLRHRRAALPERSALESVQGALAALDAKLTEVIAQRHQVTRRQQRLEDEVASLDAKITELDRRLYSGTITAIRELQALQAEVESLKHRRSSVEDQVLEAMVEAEPLDAEVAQLERERAELAGKRDALAAAVTEAEAVIDAELQSERERRDVAAAGLPADLMRLYEQLRAKLDGVGVAALVNGTCQGCHLTLPAVEVARIKRLSDEALVRCDQCGRILVRS